MARKIDETLEVTLFSIGNLFSYIPLAILTKMSSKGLFAALHGRPTTGLELMPLFAVGNVIACAAFFLVSGWFRYSNKMRIFGITVPIPRWYIFVWGLCTVVQIISVIWVFAFGGVSIVFASLLMKGGLLILAPLADRVVASRRRKIYWPSYAGAALSLLALIVASLHNVRLEITMACIADVAAYLASFFIKLLIMSRWAKSHDAVEKKRYLVEGLLSTTLGLIIVIPFLGFLGSMDGSIAPLREVWNGFTLIPQMGFIVPPIAMGIFSASNGIFASFILLDRRENTFCVTLVQATSIIAGVAASVFLATTYGQPYPTLFELIGTGIILFAIVLLSQRERIERRNTNASIMS